MKKRSTRKVRKTEEEEEEEEEEEADKKVYCFLFFFGKLFSSFFHQSHEKKTSVACVSTKEVWTDQISILGLAIEPVGNCVVFGKYVL
jgi:hypothetical protein